MQEMSKTYPRNGAGCERIYFVSRFCHENVNIISGIAKW